MKNITLILGGARSGKSTFAENIALSFEGEVLYLATANSEDAEMEERIKLHRSRRPARWRTWEGEPEQLCSALLEARGLVLLDCLTMWLTRLALASKEFEEAECEEEWFVRERKIMEMLKNLCEAVNAQTHLLIVSNEVGFGLVPPYLMGRRFRDMQGRANQLVAAYAQNVSLVVAGCSLFVKGTMPELAYLKYGG